MKTLTPAQVIVLKLVIGAALLTAVLSRVSLEGALNAWSRVPVVSVLAAVGLYFAAHFINALKLRVLLPRLSVAQSWRFTMIAVLYGTALPGQLAGDVVKAFRLTRAASNAGDVSATIAAVTVDKAIGLFALLIFTALGLGLDAASFGPLASQYVGFGLLLIVTALALVILSPVPTVFEKWAAHFTTWRRITLRPAPILASLAYGLVFQALSIAVFVILGAGMGIELSMAAWAVVVGLVSVILLLPVTVAGLGLRSGSLVTVIGFLGQSESAALALALGLLALNIAGALVGLVVDLAGRDQDP